MHTTSYWLTIPAAVMALLPFAADDRRDGVVGLAFAMRQIAQLLLMCDRHDIGISIDIGRVGDAGSRDRSPRGSSSTTTIRAASASASRCFRMHHELLDGTRTADRRVRVRERMPGMRRADRRHRSARQGGGARILRLVLLAEAAGGLR